LKRMIRVWSHRVLCVRMNAFATEEHDHANTCPLVCDCRGYIYVCGLSVVVSVVAAVAVGVRVYVQVVSYIGLAMLPPGDTESSGILADPEDRFAAFLEDRKRRTPAGGTMPLASSSIRGIEVRSVASAPGDPFARFAFGVADPDVSARFYCDTLGMKEVFRSETEVCVRYVPPKDNFPPQEDSSQSTSWGPQVPTTLVFTEQAASGTADGDLPSMGTQAFDHLAVSCANIEAARAFLAISLPATTLSSETSTPSVFLEPTEM